MDIQPMFKFLINYDMAIVTEPNSKHHFLQSHSKTNPIDMVSDTNRMFETNSGMILFKKSDQFFRFLQRIYELHSNGSDQHYYHLTEPIRGLLGKSKDIRILQLPLEYNLRYHQGKEPVYLRGEKS
jgi:hypothetical protein